jgi:hypothetical protein
MKKLLTLAAVAVLILGLAGATYAVELKANGFFTNLTAWGTNLGWPAGFPGPDAPFATTNTGYDDTFAWNMIWTHLDFTLEASEDLRGVIGFEGGPAEWGAAGSHGAVYPGFTANVYQAYVDFKIPGTDAFPTRAVVGLQPWFFTSTLAIGEYGPGVRLNSTVGPASISLLWRKHEENVEWQSDDMDSYGASVSVPAGPVTASFWSMYYMIRTGANSFVALPAGVTADGYHWYNALNVRGAVGPVAITGDFVYGMRQVEYNYPVLGAGWYGQPVVWDGEDTSGWVVRANASVPVAMLTVGGEFMYATGADYEDWWNDNEWSGYVYPIPVQNYFGLNVATIGDAGLVYFKSFTNVFPGITGQAGGDWYAKGFARMKPLEWMSVSFAAMYIGDTVSNGDKIGTAVDFLGFPEDNGDVGIEVDLVTSISIMDNLSYEIGVGYLFAGSALDQFVGIDPLTGWPLNDSPKDPWVVLSNLSYRF